MSSKVALYGGIPYVALKLYLCVGTAATALSFPATTTVAGPTVPAATPSALTTPICTRAWSPGRSLRITAGRTVRRPAASTDTLTLWLASTHSVPTLSTTASTICTLSEPSNQAVVDRADRTASSAPAPPCAATSVAANTCNRVRCVAPPGSLATPDRTSGRRSSASSRVPSSQSAVWNIIDRL